jgi:hypothetical protein
MTPAIHQEWLEPESLRLTLRRYQRARCILQAQSDQEGETKRAIQGVRSVISLRELDIACWYSFFFGREESTDSLDTNAGLLRTVRKEYLSQAISKQKLVKKTLRGVSMTDFEEKQVLDGPSIRAYF